MSAAEPLLLRDDCCRDQHEVVRFLYERAGSRKPSHTIEIVCKHRGAKHYTGLRFRDVRLNTVAPLLYWPGDKLLVANHAICQSGHCGPRMLEIRYRDAGGFFWAGSVEDC